MEPIEMLGVVMAVLQFELAIRLNDDTIVLKYNQSTGATAHGFTRRFTIRPIIAYEVPEPGE